VSPVKYELGFYIPEDDILHSHGRENLKSYVCFGAWFVKASAGDSPTISPVSRKPEFMSVHSYSRAQWHGRCMQFRVGAVQG
jgi:hypothetical protein